MKDHKKFFKTLGFILLLFVLLSTVALSKNSDKQDKEVPEISVTSGDTSSPLPADADDTENIDPMDDEAAEISVTSGDTSQPPLAEAEDTENIDPMDGEAAEISVTSAGASSLDDIDETNPAESIDTKDNKAKGNPNPGIVMPPNSKPGGLTYGEWNAEWWKWVFSIPYDGNHPLYDDTPPDSTDSSEVLPGKVLFLGSSFSGVEEDGMYLTEVDRDITISPGTKIFIPIFNAEASELEGNGDTEEELQAVADSYLVDVSINSVKIDGVSVQNPEQYESPSGLFEFGPLPPDNVLEEAYGIEGTEGETSDSVANGYYLMLPPLSVGEHTIEFTATWADAWTQDVTYTITVEPEKGKSDAKEGNGKE